MTNATAPGKLILCGEHAVVYGRPAIALPLSAVRAQVTVTADSAGSGVTIDACELGRCWTLTDNAGDPLSELVVDILDYLAVATTPDLHIRITSAIPIAGGMGSGAAVATALVRALTTHLGCSLSAPDVSALVYANERRLHGTPSGIDNTVVVFEQPIWFVRASAQGDRIVSSARSVAEGTALPVGIEPLVVTTPFTLLIGDTGVRSPTRGPVGEVRRRWHAEPTRYEALFDAIGTLVHRARDILGYGNIVALGTLLDQNHMLLQELGVSSLELDRLVETAREAGALGAKLSGAGWGGVMLALVTPETRERVAAALLSAGATQVLETVVRQGG